MTNTDLTTNVATFTTLAAGVGDFINGTAKADKALPGMVAALLAACEHNPDGVIATLETDRDILSYTWHDVEHFARGTDRPALEPDDKATPAKTHASNIKQAFLLQAPAGKRLVASLAAAKQTIATAKGEDFDTFQKAQQARADEDTLGKRLNASRKVIERACLIAVYLADQIDAGKIAGVEVDGPTIYTRTVANGKRAARTIKSLDKEARDTMRTKRQASGATHAAGTGETGEGTSAATESAGIGGASGGTRNVFNIKMRSARMAVEGVKTSPKPELSAEERTERDALFRALLADMTNEDIAAAFVAAEITVEDIRTAKAK